MDVGELLQYQPPKEGKRRLPDDPSDKRPSKSKKIFSKSEERGQARKILKKSSHQESSSSEASSAGGEDVFKITGPLTQEDKERLLALVEDDDAGETIDESTIKKHILSFERKVTKNQEMRIKFPDMPQKFMESELELHDEIHKLNIIATVPEYYEIFVKLNAVSTALGLIGHENSDISIATIELLEEVTESDNLNENEEGANALVNALMNGELVTVLLQNLQRLDEKQKGDANGVHNTLAIVENLAEFRPDICVTAGEQGLHTWLLKRIRKRMFDSNKLYASEILAIMLQNHEENRQLIGETNGVDNLLQALAVYKGHNPNNQEEIEYMENLFNCLCSALLHGPNKELFLKGEGLQLMILMLREKKMSRTSALKVLAYAMTGEEGGDNCSKFVEILGLRSVFPLFMKAPKRNKKTGNSVEEGEEHSCSIIASLFRHLSAGQRTRLIQKFVEDDHVKIDRLMELYRKYQRRVQATDARIEREKEDLEEQGEIIDETMEDEFYLNRLDSGLFTLQLIVCILLEGCCAGVQSIKQRVITILAQHGGSLKQIKQVMREYAGHIGGDAASEQSEIEKRRLLSLVDRF